MRIRTFCKFVEVSELEPLSLRDAAVVVDGQNFFYNSYELSALPHQYGCEGDRYAAYVRERLAMFKKANVTCYFLFKGGHENMDKRLKKDKDKELKIVPIFTKNIYREVLKEMKFNYVICEYESKRDIIALAQQLNCPVISYDIEFCFSGIQYIPSNELKFDIDENTIKCRYFLLENFFQKYNLNAEKIAVFIVLTDANIFEDGFFTNLFQHLKLPLSYFRRHLNLLIWLKKTNKKQIEQTIFKFLSVEEQKKFLEEVNEANQFVNRRESGGLCAATLLDRGAARVAHADPDWFAKGVAGEHVAIDYINLYRSKHFYSSRIMIPLSNQDDPVILSLDIVKYAYDLLTNFNNDGFTLTLLTNMETVAVAGTQSIRKPDYSADVCVFENGWGSVRDLGLLEHFLRESLHVELSALERLPAPAKLLVATLLYFARKKPAYAGAEVRCVLLGYVTLSLVFPKAANTKRKAELPFPSKPILDSTTDEDSVTADDCCTAAAILESYHTVGNSEADGPVDRELLHPLVEFQHCLLALADLNALCGAPLPPPALRRSFNGSLVYRLRRAMRDAGDHTQFLDRLLSPAPTVYAFLNGLIEAYEEMFKLC